MPTDKVNDHRAPLCLVAAGAQQSAGFGLGERLDVDVLPGRRVHQARHVHGHLAALPGDLERGASGDVGEYFESVMDAWLSERENTNAFDWRYYLVKYPSMRTGATGIYYGVDGKLGYSMCMLRTTQLNGYYRDPILLEVWESSGVGERVQDPWFRGYETSPRWLRLERSGDGTRSVSNGFALQGPEDEAHRSTFIDLYRRHEAVDIADESIVLTIPQYDHGDGLVDSQDRVIVGAAFLRELVEADL